MVEGTEYRLKCDITNVAPVQKLKVTWYRGNETVETQMFNDTSEIPVNVSSTFRITPERDSDGELFRCDAKLHLGPNGPKHVPTKSSSPFKAVVHCELSSCLFFSCHSFLHTGLILNHLC